MHALTLIVHSFINTLSKLFATLPKDVQIGLTIGIPLGALLTLYMFNNVQWYHDWLVWSWTNPWLLGAGLLSGIVIALLDD